MEHNGHFIVYSDLLKNYIKDRHPQVFVVASVIKPIMRFQGPNRIETATAENETNYYNELIKDYDMVVVRPEYSKYILSENPELINNLSKIEILTNSHCMANCKNAPNHYKLISKYFHKDINTPFNCVRNMHPLEKINNSLLSTNVHPPETIRKLIQAGIKNLKIQGRANNTPIDSMLTIICHKMFNTEENYDFLFNTLIQCELAGELKRYYQAINT